MTKNDAVLDRIAKLEEKAAVKFAVVLEKVAKLEKSTAVMYDAVIEKLDFRLLKLHAAPTTFDSLQEGTAALHAALSKALKTLLLRGVTP